MSTITHTATVPVGIAPSGVTLTLPLRGAGAVLVAGIAGTGKSVLLHRMRGALELQHIALLHAEGIRANANEMILAARDELRRRIRERRIEDSPVVLLVDDYGVLCIGRDHGGELVRAVEEIAVKGRTAGVHLVLATQGTEGIGGRLLMNLSTRIVLGPLVHPISRVFSDQERERIEAVRNARTDLHAGLLVGVDGQTVPFTALPLESR